MEVFFEIVVTALWYQKSQIFILEMLLLLSILYRTVQIRLAFLRLFFIWLRQFFLSRVASSFFQNHIWWFILLLSFGSLWGTVTWWWCSLGWFYLVFLLLVGVSIRRCTARLRWFFSAGTRSHLPNHVVLSFLRACEFALSSLFILYIFRALQCRTLQRFMRCQKKTVCTSVVIG